MTEQKTLLVQLSVSDIQSGQLHDTVRENLESRHIDISTFHKVQPVHCTLAFHSDLPDFEQTVEQHYRPQIDTKFTISVVGLAKDSHCVALVVERNSLLLPFSPADKHPHLTMALHRRKPVYSNVLLSRILPDVKSGKNLARTDLYIDLAPIQVTCDLEIKTFSA